MNRPLPRHLVVIAVAGVLVALAGCGSPSRSRVGEPTSPGPVGSDATSVVLSPRPAPSPSGGGQAFAGTAALQQPAGLAATLYLQARADAAVSDRGLAALPAFFVPGSPDLARETYLARGQHIRWTKDGWPPASTTDTVRPDGAVLTVDGTQGEVATLKVYAVDETTFAQGRSDQEGDGLDHTITLEWVHGSWLVRHDAYADDTAAGALALGGAPTQMTQAVAAQGQWTSGQGGPAEVRAAARMLGRFIALVDLGRFAAAQQIVAPESGLFAAQLGREVHHLALVRTHFVDVPGKSRIQLEAVVTVGQSPAAPWRAGRNVMFVTLERQSLGGAWRITDFAGVK